MGVCSILVKVVNLIFVIALIVVVYASQGYTIPGLSTTLKDDAPLLAVTEQLTALMQANEDLAQKTDILVSAMNTLAGSSFMNSSIALSWVLLVISLVLFLA
jgi:hypothetical protein